MKTSHIITTLAVVAVLAIANVAAAAQGDGLASLTTQGPQLGQMGNGHMQEVQQAIANNDYDTWKELIANAPHSAEMLEKITEENFHLLNEMHKARQDGDLKTAKEIADELGIEAGEFLGMGPRGPRGNNGRFQMREEVRTALENRDYNAWHDAMTPKILDYINESNFNTFADMQEAIQSGDKDTAEALRQELGLPERQAPADRMGMKIGQRGPGMHNGQAQTQE